MVLGQQASGLVLTDAVYSLNILRVVQNILNNMFMHCLDL